jgi:hypothetical protein
MRHRSTRADEPDLVPVVKMNDDNKCTAVGLAHEHEAILPGVDRELRTAIDIRERLAALEARRA